MWCTILVEAPGSPAITPDIDIRDRFLDSELITLEISDIGYQILVGFYAFWKYRSMQGDNILLVDYVFGSVRSSVYAILYLKVLVLKPIDRSNVRDFDFDFSFFLKKTNEMKPNLLSTRIGPAEG